MINKQLMLLIKWLIFALEGRNTRDQQRLLPHEQIESFSQKGLGGIRIAKNTAVLSFPIKHWHKFSVF